VTAVREEFADRPTLAKALPPEAVKPSMERDQEIDGRSGQYLLAPRGHWAPQSDRPITLRRLDSVRGRPVSDSVHPSLNPSSRNARGGAQPSLPRDPVAAQSKTFVSDEELSLGAEAILPRCNLPIINPDPTYDTVSENLPSHSLPALLTLHEVRGYLRRSHAIGLAVFLAVAYALGSMLAGGMLVLARVPGGYSVLVWWNNALGLQPWNYPFVLIEAPWGFVELPFFATFSMIAVSAGVGLGMAVAILLGVHLARARRSGSGRAAATGTIAGLTPAMIALVTLGACCSTTAAATAGVGLVAQASGSSTSNLLFNNWFLGAFQMVVVYIALVAQELLLRVYGALFAGDAPEFATRGRSSPPLDRRALAIGVLRAGLVAAGVTWILTAVADWTVVNPATASAGLWFNWLIEHGLVGGFAVLAALSPHDVARAYRRISSTVRGSLLRGVLLLGAWTLGGWVPPPLAGAGVEGFGNELLSVLGGPAWLGPVGPSLPPGPGLAFQWGFQYLLLAVFIGLVAVLPTPTFRWLAGTSPANVGNPTAESPVAVASGSLGAAR
jgi:hypothetical protein